MKLTWEHLIVPFERDEADLMVDWRWLIGDDATLVLISAMGDAFLREAADGAVYWLDTGSGEYVRIAESVDKFRDTMPKNAEEWFMPGLVGDLIMEDVLLGPGQCYSFKTPPLFGGEYRFKNFAVTDLVVHFKVQGQIHRQAKDLPDGTPLNNLKIDS